MKACAKCYRLYQDDASFCPVDGEALRPYADVPAEPAGDDQYLGKTIATHYEMRRIVADGGMGRVYEARDARSDRRIAIKLLHPEVSRDPVAVERFKREFDISKDLPHDHIVEVLDFQALGPNQFIMVMEFLDGEELRNVLKREKTIELARLVRMLSQVAVGLDEAHRRQFVHRDLKPDNIFLCGSHDGDVVKILDFGSVRINKNRERSKLTSLGTTIGSPYYMSPEQAQGAESLDHRADVFALGAILYECLTGQVPFSGPNGPAILLSILTKTPPPVSQRAKVPASVDDVIDDALAKKPETRTGSVGALADALGHAVGIPGTHVEWARTSVAALREKVSTVGPARAPAVVADPFAVDPFAAPPQGAQLAPVGAPAAPFVAPMPLAEARSAMDDAFAAAGPEPAGVPRGTNVLLFIAIVVGVALLVGGGLYLIIGR